MRNDGGATMKQGWLGFTDLVDPIVRETSLSATTAPMQPASSVGHSAANRNEVYADALGKAPSDRERILRLLQSETHFASGLTRDEIAVRLEMQLSTVCGRCRELLVDFDDGQLPAIYETVLRMPTRTGSTAVVLCARERRDGNECRSLRESC